MPPNKAFEAAGALDKLDTFASFHGADFYSLPRNTDTITLIKQPWRVPLRASGIIAWQLENL